MKTATFRIGRLEFRTCGESLPHDRGEIVLWHDRDASCHAIAYWQSTADGMDLKFIGTRPFDADVHPETFMRLARIGQEHMAS